ncbi:hypothetical protein E3P99_00740 [Wallemia hederae]|uniref:Uncharacterized protein n=1 Tax=Wallemia hederae TaxID=1540922 RepID=A0A4T0FUV7_9BASI|nr:hypothetical protein E3P99_00740 [Wallemia hederae]
MQTSVYATGESVTAQAYDFYGESMSTGSESGVLRVHRRNADNGWNEDEEMVIEGAHDARVTTLSHSYPSYGTLLASASTDRTIKIWEMRKSSTNNRLIAKFTESKAPIAQVEFTSPASLQLVSLSVDGVLRVYQATIPSDPTTWSCVHTHKATQTSSEQRKDDTFALSVCPDKEYAGLVAVVAGHTTTVDIIGYSTSSRPSVVHQLTVNAPISSVQWSPGCKRGFWHVAVGSRDGLVRIFKVAVTQSETDAKALWDSHLVAELEHGGVVASLSWNVFGTVLTSSGDNATANVWKASYTGVWSCHSTYSISE